MTAAMLHLVAISLLPVSIARSEIIDRIAVSVGNRVITRSEIDRQARLTAFLNQEEPDLSAAGRRKTAERMVEQRLVLRELEASRYPAPAPSEADVTLARLKSRYKTQQAYEEALHRYGITEQDLRDHLLWQMRFLRFIDVRFRPGVQVTDEEVQDYFNKVIRPAAMKENGGRAPALDDYREMIEQVLEAKRVDAELERWLQAARRRTRVEYREGAFQ